MTEEVKEPVAQTQAEQSKKTDGAATTPQTQVPAAASAATQSATADNSPPKEPTANTDETKKSSTNEQAPPERVASLELVIVDDKSHGIPNLALRVIDVKETNLRKKTLFDGTADAKGRVPLIENVPFGTLFEIQIKRDRGDYKFSARGTIDVAGENVASLRIPCQRFEFTTFTHVGASGKAEAHVKELISKHNQTPEAKPDISRNPPEKKPELIVDRNKDGNPVVIVKDGQKNMMGTNAAKVPFANAGKTDVEKVNALIQFAMEQITWAHPSSKTTDIILREMRGSGYAKTKRTKGDGKGYSQSLRACNKYVKVALGYCNFGGEEGPAPAHKMGPALEAAGFKNIIKDLPDARWAAPGDVIVYLDKKNPENAGHIDIRTYDGYVSDFWDSYLPVSGYIVTGIYRKYYDPLPEKRMRAFLKVIRSREAHTLFHQSGDEATYAALPLTSVKKGEPISFTSFARHPFSDKKNGYPSGAYGIRVDTWNLYLPKWVVPAKNEDQFSPEIQDRIAVAIMEMNPGQGWGSAEYQTKIPTSLALVRMGKIEEAARQLATARPKHPPEWPSLPGGDQTNNYSASQMLSDYEKFYAELK